MKSIVLVSFTLTVLIAYVACAPGNPTITTPKEIPTTTEAEAPPEHETKYPSKPGDKADHNDGSYKNKRDAAHVLKLEENEKKVACGGDHKDGDKGKDKAADAKDAKDKKEEGDKKEEETTTAAAAETKSS